MKELVEYIAKAIATYPDDVEVTEEETGDGEVLVTLTVNSEDKGKVIGRQGRVAQAMRVLLRVAAVKNDLLVNLEIK
ncbi:MAG: RNA-binding protein [Chloroflexi bacterium]|nr:RNA-binding protein [Chloroflexota bacterium]MBT17858.1 RNA-binding protein [Dehalococcoidia bacterium]|tara:strand:+ start:3521 stop:3751 length:231 start_codon:yes stop_codon:yes gene_type:complete